MDDQMKTGKPKPKNEETYFGATILVVDDDPEDLEIIAELLSTRGYKVECANSGQEALDRLPTTLPDLVLTDLSMPGMDGLQLCEKIRRTPRWHTIPVIFITGFADQVKAGFRAGASDYVCKPFSAEELLARIRVHLTNHAALEVLAHQEKILRRKLDASEHDRHEAEVSRDHALLEARLARQEAIMARDVLRDLGNAKSRFIAQASLALRTPLNALGGYTELLDEGTLDGEQRNYINLLKASEREIENLVEEMLDYAECIDGSKPRNPEPFSPVDVLNRVRAACEEIAIYRDLTLKTEFDPALPNLCIGDAETIFKVCREMVSGALHQGSGARVILFLATATDASADRQRVRVVVEAGCSTLPETVLEHMRQSAWVEPTPELAPYSDLMMRYALAKSLAQSLGAPIGVEPCEGGGFRFWLELDLEPISRPAAAGAGN